MGGWPVYAVFRCAHKTSSNYAWSRTDGEGLLLNPHFVRRNYIDQAMCLWFYEQVVRSDPALPRLLDVGSPGVNSPGMTLAGVYKAAMDPTSLGPA